MAGGLAAYGAASAPAQSAPPKLGLIGLGNRAQRHFTALRGLSGVEISALSDLQPDRMQAAKKGQAANAQTYIDHRELIRDPNVQAVVIAVPNYLHADMAIEAMRAGKDVLLEKPIGLNWQQAKRVAAAAKRHGRILAVGMQRHYAADYSAIRKFVNGGGLGKLSLMSLSEYRGDWHPKTTTVDGFVWRHQRKYAGSSLLEFSVHSYGFLYEMIEAPLIECSASGGAVHWPERTTEDVIAVIGRYANGVRASHSYCGYAPGVPWRLTIVGEKGSLDYDRTTATVRREGDEPFSLELKGEASSSNEQQMYRAFFEAVRTRKQPPLNPDFALEATKLAYAAWLSIDEGRIVTDKDFA